MPQLNFTIPADLLDRIDAAKPDFLDRKGFICLLLSNQLDKSGKLGGPSEAGTPFCSSYSSSIDKSIEEELKPLELKPKARVRVREADPYKPKTISSDLVPSDLLDCQQLLPEWWAVKKGVRSEGVWRRVCGKLRGWTPEQRREALARAIASGWGDVFEPTPARANSAPLSASGVPMTASEQIAASALRKIKAMEAANAPLF